MLSMIITFCYEMFYYGVSILFIFYFEWTVCKLIKIRDVGGVEGVVRSVIEKLCNWRIGAM